jgi:hypothetical protein
MQSAEKHTPNLILNLDVAPRPSIPAADVDVIVVTCAGSVAFMPATRSARAYCEAMFGGWQCTGNTFFVPRAHADLILQLLTRRYSCRVDGEVVS